MAKMEKEVKILDVDVDYIIDAINANGGVLATDCIQKIYTYDLGTIVGRYRDLLLQFKDDNFELMKSKFKLLFFEVDNLLDSDSKQLLLQNFGEQRLLDTVVSVSNQAELKTFATESVVENIISKFKINPNKWVRLRETDDVTTLAIKNILQDTEDNIQPVLETEMIVPSIKEANEMLEQLGYVFRNYQEKRRITYKMNGIELDIDFWPLIPPYLEIEGNTILEINEIIEILNLQNQNIVSCNTEEVYKKYNINIYDYRELRLDEKSKCRQNMLEYNRKV